MILFLLTLFPFLCTSSTLKTYPIFWDCCKNNQWLYEQLISDDLSQYEYSKKAMNSPYTRHIHEDPFCWDAQSYMNAFDDNINYGCRRGKCRSLIYIVKRQIFANVGKKNSRGERNWWRWLFGKIVYIPASKGKCMRDKRFMRALFQVLETAHAEVANYYQKLVHKLDSELEDNSNPSSIKHQKEKEEEANVEYIHEEVPACCIEAKYLSGFLQRYNFKFDEILHGDSDEICDLANEYVWEFNMFNLGKGCAPPRIKDPNKKYKATYAERNDLPEATCAVLDPWINEITYGDKCHQDKQFFREILKIVENAYWEMAQRFNNFIDKIDGTIDNEAGLEIKPEN